MKQVIALLILALVAWGGYRHFTPPAPTADAALAVTSARQPSTPERVLPAPTQRFSCDGRQHCSQMHSCEEAKFFIRNCPNTKMDGDNDGVPCESQHCS